ncbi:LamG-like jellyroll fold domain-containing protein [Trinickia terrae]|nr:LamG-like jellyroll fold domain-containing protein [Trinickia terrae]
MAQKVAASASPWVDSWNELIASPYGSTSWTPTPHAVVYRNYPGQTDNFLDLCHDAAAAYANALRWKIKGDTTAANTAVKILNAWGSTLTQIATTNGYYDGYLVAGIQGYQIANAAEMMRSYTGWATLDFTTFQNMMLNVFYPMNQGTSSTTGNALAVYSSWDLCAMGMVLAVGVLCDNSTIFNEAITYFKEGFGNGAIAQMVYFLHPGYLGQTQEAGRDQGHDTLSISLLGTVCEMAWNQGVDLYAYDNNRVLAACEYVAKGNLIESGSTYYPVPFEPYAVSGSSTIDTAFSTASQGAVRPEWALIYNHYVNRRGIAAPYSEKFAALISPEGGAGYYGTTSGGFDQLGYGTLAFQRDAISAGVAPSGLTALTVGGSIVLSWWGTVYANGYNVYRSTISGGSYTLIASGATDLLTYTDSTISSGTYYYVVTAVTSTGETAYSNQATGVASTLLDVYYTFNDGSGTTASDASGNSYAGTLAGGATWVTGHSGTAVSLDGSSGYVSVPAGVLAGVSDFTIAVWVYLNAQGWSARLFDFGFNTNRRMMFTPRWGNDNARFGIALNGDVGMQFIQGSSALPTGQWVHVAVTLSGTTGTYYLNGSVAGTNTSLWLPPCQLGSTPNNYIGRSQSSSDPYLNGIVDEFRIYKGALTAAQISTLAAS